MTHTDSDRQTPGQTGTSACMLWSTRARAGICDHDQLENIKFPRIAVPALHVHVCACMHCVRACACLQLTVRTRQRQREDRTQRPGCAAPHVISVRTFVSQRDFNEDLHFCVLCSCCCPLAGLSLNMHVCFYVCSSASKYSVTLVLCMQTVCIYVCARCCSTCGCT